MYIDTHLFSIIQISEQVYSRLRLNLISEGYKITPCKNECEKLEKIKK